MTKETKDIINFVKFIYFFSDVINFEYKESNDDNGNDDNDEDFDDDDDYDDDDYDDDDYDDEFEDEEDIDLQENIDLNLINSPDDDEEFDEYNDDNSTNDIENVSIIKFIENDDTVIYCLILSTDLNYIYNFLLQNILNNRNSTELLVKENNVVTIFNTIFEIVNLFYYWHNNLSEKDKIKSVLSESCPNLSRKIKTFIYVLDRFKIESEELKIYIYKTENILNLQPFIFNDDLKDDIKDLDANISLYSYVYDIIRDLFEEFLKINVSIVSIAKKDFYQVLYDGNHNPHISLLLSFVSLYSKMNNKFIEFYYKYIGYYFKGILMFKNKKETKDITVIMCNLDENLDKKLLKRDTEIYGGKDENNNDIIFRTIKNKEIGSFKILTVRSVFRSFKLNNSYESDYRIAEYSMQEVYEKNQNINLFSKTKINDNSLFDSKNNFLGYVITSSILSLSSGDRKIFIEFCLEEYSLFFLDSILKKKYSSKNIDFLNSFCRTLRNSISIEYTSEDEFVNVPKENLKIYFKNAENILVFEIFLSQKMPKICTPSKKLKTEFKYDFPGIKFLARDKASFWSFIMFFYLNFYAINIKVEVDDYTDLLLQNDVNIIENNLPFRLFGPMPDINSNIYIGGEEVFNKNLNYLRLNIEWENIPDIGLDEYYRFYNQNTKTSDFKVAISFLRDRRWEPVDNNVKQVNNLFEYTVNDEKFEKLNKTTCIDINVEKLKLNTDYKFKYNTSYISSSTVEGFLKLQLVSPSYGFGYKLYYETISKNLLTQKNKLLKTLLENKINEPYVPVVRKLSVSFCSEKMFLKNSIKKDEFIMYRIHPFGYYEAEFLNYKNTNETSIEAFDKHIKQQQYLDSSNISIELSNVKTNFVSLFFNIDEYKIYKRDTIIYEIGYISNNTFIPFLQDDILINTTDNFKKSGVIKLKLPKDILIGAKKNTYMRSSKENTLWIEIWFLEEEKYMPTILNIYTNPVYVKRLSDNNSVYLPELSLEKIIDDEYSDISIFQPFPSYNGLQEETDEELYYRISTRLLSKDRCITITDYKNFILENFKEIDDVIEIKSDDDTEEEPGSFTLMVIRNKDFILKNTSNFNYNNDLILSKIKDMIKQKCSYFSNVNIINPYYEKITVILRVIFKEGYEKNNYINILNDDICNYISPWLYDKTAKISIKKSISVLNLVKFIKSQKYIKHLIDIHILKNEDNKLKYTKNFNDIVYQTYPYSILYSAKHHVINVDDGINQFNSGVRLEDSVIEENFIVGLEASEEKNHKSDEQYELIETFEDNFMVFK